MVAVAAVVVVEVVVVEDAEVEAVVVEVVAEVAEAAGEEVKHVCAGSFGLWNISHLYLCIAMYK